MALLHGAAGRSTGRNDDESTDSCVHDGGKRGERRRHARTNRLIRACMTAAFAFGLAFAASTFVDDTAEARCRMVAGHGVVCPTGNRRATRRSDAEIACRAKDQRRWRWNRARQSCDYLWSTGGADRSRGSCAGYPHGQGGYGSHCDAGMGHGFMPIGGFGEDGPSVTFSFWEWLLWNQDRSSGE